LFKINQSLVEQMSMNKSVIVITPKPVVSLAEQEPSEEEMQAIEEQPAIDPAEQAQRTIQNASEKAEEIIRDAYEKAAKIRESALQEGYNKGKSDAAAEISEFMQEQTNMTRSVFANLEKYKGNLYGELQESLLQLSFDIAEKILNCELKRDDKVYEGIIIKAIQELKSAEKLVIHVSKAEYERFFKSGTEWLQGNTGGVPFEVICDNKLGEEGCILESGDEVLNASTHVQLGRIRHQLEEKAETNARTL
jgi:flagellar biosynthesis/type III secretory pathway protein FliH